MTKSGSSMLKAWCNVKVLLSKKEEIKIYKTDTNSFSNVSAYKMYFMF